MDPTLIRPRPQIFGYGNAVLQWLGGGLFLCLLLYSTAFLASQDPGCPTPPLAHNGSESDQRDLWAAAANGSSQIVLDLLKVVSPIIRDEKGWTPLHHAAANDHKKNIEILLRCKDKDPNGKWLDYSDWTPLHVAAWRGNEATVQQFLEIRYLDWTGKRAKAKEAIQNLQAATGHKFDKEFAEFFAKKSFTPRELAVLNRHPRTAIIFDRKSQDDILKALSCACMLGDIHTVSEIWNWHNIGSWHQGIDYWQGGHNPDGQVHWFPAPPLHLAVMSGSLDTVHFLLKNDRPASYAQVNDQSARGWSIFPWNYNGYPPYSSPAHYAAIVGSASILERLGRRRADSTTLDRFLRTPLSHAVERLHVDVVELLAKQISVETEVKLSRAKASRRHLGSGHKLTNEQREAVARSEPIVKALETIGVFV